MNEHMQTANPVNLTSVLEESDCRVPFSSGTEGNRTLEG